MSNFNTVTANSNPLIATNIPRAEGGATVARLREGLDLSATMRDGYTASIPNPLATLGAGASHPERPELQLLGMVQTRLQAMLDSPDFRAMLSILEIAREMKETATEMINSGSGEVDERLMATVNQVLKEVETLQTFAKSIQDSVNRTRESIARAS